MEESCNKYLNFDKTVGIKIVLSSDISYPDWVYELINGIGCGCPKCGMIERDKRSAERRRKKKEVKDCENSYGIE